MANPAVTVNGFANYADLSQLTGGGVSVTLGVQNPPTGSPTYNWTIVDQPPNVGTGSQAVLTGPTSAAPTFTISNTGSYEIQCVLNQGLPTQQAVSGVAFVRELVSGERIPAANESTETDGLSATETGAGWAVSLNSLIRRLSQMLGDPGNVVAVTAASGYSTTNFVAPGGSSTTGSPTGPDGLTYPVVKAVTAQTGSKVAHGSVGVLVSGVNGASVGGAGNFVNVRMSGPIYGISSVGASPAPVVGNPVYVTNSGSLDSSCTAPGTVSRTIGTIMAINTTANTFDVFIQQSP